MIKYKSMFASKTFYATLIAALVGVYNILAPDQKWPAIPNEVFGILGAFGLWGVRTADSTIVSPGHTPPSAPAAAVVTENNVVPNGVEAAK